MRLDVYLAQFWPEQSRSQWQRLCRAGAVSVNGQLITSPKYELGEDDAVSVSLPAVPDFSHDTIPALYEDDQVVVLNKPSGMLTHAKGANLEEFSVAEYMRRHVADAGNRPGIVHRLDRDTSGVIICVKDDATRSYLQKQFSNRTVKKQYLAVVVGRPKLDEATIDLPIERNPKQPASFRVGAAGKPALTDYRLVWTDGRHSLLLLKPRTGRTHQLRVHLQYLNTPILNDRVYGSAKAGQRLGLHAYSLEITLPGGKRRTFVAPPPTDFKALEPALAPDAVEWNF